MMNADEPLVSLKNDRFEWGTIEPRIRGVISEFTAPIKQINSDQLVISQEMLLEQARIAEEVELLSNVVF